MADNFYGSICLNDIPKELITTAKNGKKYLNVVVNRRREVGQYGHTHYIKAYAKKGTVSPDTNLYIGELKPSEYDNNGQQGGGYGGNAPGYPVPDNNGNDGLPF
ncbi:MAG: hypothetical protein NC131_15755 [Roseburia sp.]|nr:hypothetical protein [Roseburia sp.]